MALVANLLPNDAPAIGKRVAYFDPTFDMAGLKYGRIKTITYGVSGVQLPLTYVVTPEAGGGDVTGGAAFFRVVDNIIGKLVPNV